MSSNLALCVEDPVDCQILAIREVNDLSCVSQHFTGHDLQIDYSEKRNGEWQKYGEITITSWYNQANVEFVDLLKDGRNFTVVEFEGNVGTGVHEKVLAIIGWHNGKFRLSALEGLSFYIEKAQKIQDLKVRHSFIQSRDGTPELQLQYEFIQKNDFAQQTVVWTDILRWKDETYSFCEQAITQEDAKDQSFEIRNKIRFIRATTCENTIDPRIIDVELLAKLGILNIIE